ncbi:serine/threonine-protein kinase [Actinoplanes sp. CA-051413]|uniref:serine/threonine-protein kinase n=1 Tax=Actinoplanes sp. CA-051413 TaxID=3239899 RepID=UPI003D9804C0
MLHAGLRLGDRYRLDARIGAGGMGEVWRAVDEVLGRVVAVKAMLPGVADQPDFAKRFLVEAKAMASVNHPAVASIHDYGRGAGITYLVMEFIDGESLSQLLAREGRLDPVTTMRLVAQAADGLEAVHERGIVHRDIKPANLLVRRNGALLITDFGISRTEDGTQLTASGAVLGTPTYLSPEQVLGQPATGRSDIYSLGLAAYECLAGRRPFEGDNPYAVALQRLQAAPRTLGGDIPAPVLAVVERALATDPADRWPSAAAMAEAARAAVGPGPTPRAPRPSTSRSRRWAVLAAALVVLVVAGGVALWQTLRPDPHGGPAVGAGTSGPAAPGVVRPAGFVTCGPLLCPAEPLCWAGVTAINGRASSPRDLDCAGDHTWETFAATALPADVSRSHEDELLLRKDIAAACSARVMADRSRDRAATDGWEREAWPIEVPGTDQRLVHCLARPEQGEPTGSAFTSS